MSLLGNIGNFLQKKVINPVGGFINRDVIHPVEQAGHFVQQQATPQHLGEFLNSVYNPTTPIQQAAHIAQPIIPKLNISNLAAALGNTHLQGLEQLTGHPVTIGGLAHPLGSAVDQTLGGVSHLANQINYGIQGNSNPFFQTYTTMYKQGKINDQVYSQLMNEAGQKAGFNIGDTGKAVLRKTAAGVAGPTATLLTFGSAPEAAETLKGAPLGTQVLKGAAGGAGAGALFGGINTLGQQDKITPGSAVSNIGGGAAVGGLLGGALPLAGAALKKLGSGILKDESGHIALPQPRDDAGKYTLKVTPEQLQAHSLIDHARGLATDIQAGRANGLTEAQLQPKINAYNAALDAASSATRSLGSKLVAPLKNERGGGQIDPFAKPSQDPVNKTPNLLYRGVKQNELVNGRGWLGTHLTDSLKEAQGYAGKNGQVYTVNRSDVTPIGERTVSFNGKDTQNVRISNEEASKLKPLEASTKLNQAHVEAKSSSPPTPTVKAPKLPAPGELKQSLVDSSKPSITPDVQAALADAAKNAGTQGKTGGVIKEIRNLFSPVQGKGGQIIKNDLRASVGNLELQKGQLANKTDEAVKFWGKQTPEDHLTFIHKVENGLPQGSPALDAKAAEFRNGFNQDYELAKQIKPSTPYVDNYFTHNGIWKDPKAAEEFYNKWATTSLGGKPGALEHRAFPTILDGIKGGLGVKETNPQVLANANRTSLLKAHMAQDFINQEQTKGMNPTDVQKVLDRYLGRGLKDSASYQSARQMGNTLNQAQLSLSGFHVGGTAINSTLSQFSNGLNDMLRGFPLKGGAEIVTSPVAPIKDFLTGGKILKDFKAGNITSDIQNIAEGGGRFGQTVNYHATGLAQSLKDIQTGTVKGIAKGVATAPLRALSSAAKPVMEVWVPRLKLGATKALIDSKLASLGKDAAPDAIRAAKAEAVDSIDNRFGQLIKDNLFWDQKVKDVSHLLMRSPGWNIGTVREVGGGAANLLKPSTYKGLANMQGLPENTSYTLSLAAGTALMGGTLQYLYTGKWPTDSLSFFYPQTGRTDKNGNPERVSLPTYAKDIFSFFHDPVQTAKNKANPIVSEASQLFSNKDYFGNQIRNPQDSLGTQAKQVGGYLLKGNLPFTLSNSNQRVDKTLGTKAQTFFGVNPAPGYITKSKFEQNVQEALNHALGNKSLTPEEAALVQAKSNAKQGAQGGDPALIDKLVQSGQITQKQGDNLKASATQSSLQNTFNYLVTADRGAAAKLIQNASPADIKKLGDTSALVKTLSKSLAAGTASPNSLKAAQQILDKLGVTPDQQATAVQQAKTETSTKTKATKGQSDPKQAYQTALKKYQDAKKAGTLNPAQDVKAQQSLAKQAITSQYDPAVVDFYNLSNADKNAMFKSDPTTAKGLYDQAKQLEAQLGGKKLKSVSSSGVKIRKAKAVKVKKAPKITVPHLKSLHLGRAPKIASSKAPRLKSSRVSFKLPKFTKPKKVKFIA